MKTASLGGLTGPAGSLCSLLGLLRRFTPPKSCPPSLLRPRAFRHLPAHPRQSLQVLQSLHARPPACHFSGAAPNKLANKTAHKLAAWMLGIPPRMISWRSAQFQFRDGTIRGLFDAPGAAGHLSRHTACLNFVLVDRSCLRECPDSLTLRH